MFYQSITTRYLGVTDRHKPRIKATSSSGISVTIEPAEDDADSHYEALLKLVNKLGWYGTWWCGALDRGKARVWVMAAYAVKINAPEPTQPLSALNDV